MLIIVVSVYLFDEIADRSYLTLLFFMLPKNITEGDVKNESALLFLHEKTADLDIELLRQNDPAFVKLQRTFYNPTRFQLHHASSSSSPCIRPIEIPDLFPEDIRPKMKKRVSPFRKNIQQFITDSSFDLDALSAMISSRRAGEPTMSQENLSKRLHCPSTAEFEFPPDLSGYNVKRCGSNIICNGRTVEPLIDSSSLLVDGAENALFERFKTDGYLYFKKLLNKDDILKSKAKILGEMRKMDLVDDNEFALNKTGWTLETKYGTVISGTSEFSNDSDATEMEKWRRIGTNEEIEAICNSNALKIVLTMLSLGKSSSDNCPNVPRTFDPNYTWIRIKAPGECTVNHADLFYFIDSTKMFSQPGTNREYGDTGSINCEDEQVDAERTNFSCLHCRHCDDKGRDEKLLLCDECNAPYHMDTCLNPSIEVTPKDLWFCPTCNQSRPTLGTCWIPLDDVDVDHGVLAVLSGSHYLPNFEAKLKNSQIPKSFFTKTEFNRNLIWKTCKFSAGDCVLFDSKLIHCTSKNYRQTYRVSLDFRWYIEPIGRTNCLETNQGKFVRAVSRTFDLSRAEVVQFQQAQRRRELLERTDEKEKGEENVTNRPLRNSDDQQISFTSNVEHDIFTKVSDGNVHSQMTSRITQLSSTESHRHSKLMSILLSDKSKNSIALDATIGEINSQSVHAVRSCSNISGTGSKRKHNLKEQYDLSSTQRSKHVKMEGIIKKLVKSFVYWRNVTFSANRLYIDQINRRKEITFKPDLKDFEFFYLLATLSERETCK